MSGAAQRVRAGRPAQEGTMSDTHDVRRVHLWVSGRVQGVFFRSATREQAKARGLTGWVRNAPDGRVEAEVQGARDAVDQLIAHCRSGPPAAEVHDIEVHDIAVISDERSFDVAH
jgi:acylphosphatase